MTVDPDPQNEAERLAFLRSCEILDTGQEPAFDHVSRLAARVAQCPVALVGLVDAERVWFKSRHGIARAEVPRAGFFCAQAILAPGEVMVVPDAARDARFAGHALVAEEPGLRFYAGIPLAVPGGGALGTLCVLDHHPRDASPALAEALRDLAGTAMTALDLHLARKQMREAARIDPLTGLVNRAALLEAVTQAIAVQRRYGTSFSLIKFDLDGFKAFNDRFGHEVADEALREVARLLRATLRSSDLLARLGSDKFAALLGGGGEVDLAKVAERMRAAVEAGMAGRGWLLTASLGAAQFDTPPADVGEALAIMDGLTRGAQLAGRNRVMRWDAMPVPLRDVP
ncbi:sensor domain-containing diguanylate cyclase [Roseomonas sp. SSH11]|uniref:Sensor domain-containing diguanylate cyclase n=1 Tax=Pararoseomonas baculiformis TaxID=2820812 RepID=A0ABS4AJG8_9PROT|nr:sensor domain-containing diguanylate cyclase [Pararoseomonas baculiformis]MBP0447178.1 sensor domain-containing diguanylate cyclase [Pararoseomonas baculiformis]